MNSQSTTDPTKIAYFWLPTAFLSQIWAELSPFTLKNFIKSSCRSTNRVFARKNNEMQRENSRILYEISRILFKTDAKIPVFYQKSINFPNFCIFHRWYGIKRHLLIVLVRTSVHLCKSVAAERNVGDGLAGLALRAEPRGRELPRRRERPRRKRLHLSKIPWISIEDLVSDFMSPVRVEGEN